MGRRQIVFVFVAVLLSVGVGAVAAASARSSYLAATAREQTVRASFTLRLPGDTASPTVRQMRAVVAAYEALARRYPTSGYSDNALWRGAGLAADAFRRFGNERDRRTALRLLRRLAAQFPSSSLARRVGGEVAELEAASPTALGSPPSMPERRPLADRDPSREPIQSVAVPQDGDPQAALADRVPATDPSMSALRVEAPTGIVGRELPLDVGRAPPAGWADETKPPVALRGIRRTSFPDGVRITIELDEEVPVREERLTQPDRVFFDLAGTKPVPALLDATLSYDDGLVRQIRIGRHPRQVTRVVLDLDGVGRHSAFALYNPYRLVVDCERAPVAVVPTNRIGAGVVPPPADVQPSASWRTWVSGAHAIPVGQAAARTDGGDAETRAETRPPASPIPASPVAPTTLPAPAAPAANLRGGFSLARQLGLMVSRIAIDPGHGGHDPGARRRRLSEAAIALDVALRLEKLLLAQPGVQVILTRRTDVYVPLEERTAIANREAADLFLSIHVNANRIEATRGIETYFLNFASNPEAEAVAARENLASGQVMRNLPDIVKAIALNNKLDESRDFAAFVQQAMTARLRPVNRSLRDLGVKQAPFVVLIGAAMPSVLVEIAFMTNSQEAQLLGGGAYRQRVAEALLEGISRYQRSLKGVRTVAQQ